jgi:hypothetical protein
MSSEGCGDEGHFLERTAKFGFVSPKLASILYADLISPRQLIAAMGPIGSSGDASQPQLNEQGHRQDELARVASHFSGDHRDRLRLGIEVPQQNLYGARAWQ